MTAKSNGSENTLAALFFRISWKPTFFNPFLLFEQFQDAPKKGESCYSQKNGDQQIADQNGSDGTNCSG